ncbi:MAG TPA: hypothetical protein VMQ86_25615 [Bryobacteraceae bacterium]|jgi:hypothetical protein|nr:hypothetical protein [Bryobacteraceae bacterium]
MSIVDLYRSITHDQSTHYRTIQAAILRHSKRRYRLLTLYSKGFSDRQCAAKMKCTHGACRGMLLRTIRAVFKQVNGLPRYHVSGRKHARTRQEPAAADAPATPRGFKDFLSAGEREKFAR